MKQDKLARDFQSLNNALKNSFAGIKRDMNGLKSQIRHSQTVSQTSLNSLKNDIDSIKKDFVTKDKFNILRIKIGDLNESVKRLDNIEEKLKNLKDKAADKEELRGNLKTLKADIKKLQKVDEKQISEKQFQKLVQEVNNEFDIVKDDITKVENKGGKVAALKIERMSEQVDAKIDDLKAKILKLRDAVSENIKRESVENLIEDINKEFDNVKKEVQLTEEDIDEVTKDVEKLQKESAKKDDVDKKVKDLQQKLDEANSEHAEELEKLRKYLQTTLKRKGYDSDVPKVSQKKAARVVALGERKSGRALMITGNILIGTAFVALIISIVMFFIEQTMAMDILIVAAIALFVVGIVIRVIGLMKQND